jgi:hypothetical protein
MTMTDKLIAAYTSGTSYRLPGARMLAWGQLPAGVDSQDPRVVRLISRCQGYYGKSEKEWVDGGSKFPVITEEVKARIEAPEIQDDHPMSGQVAPRPYGHRLRNPKSQPLSGGG